MTKREKLLNIFTKKPGTSIEDAMRRVGASRPLAYKARQQAREATVREAKKKLVIHKSEAAMAKRLGIPLDRYAAHAATPKGITREELVKELKPGLNAFFGEDESVKRIAAACSEDPPQAQGDISRFTDERGFSRPSDQITSTLSARGEKYGPFIGHAEISRALKNVLRFYTVERKGSWQTLDADMSEALEMIAHKMARIINGDQNHTDSWVDIAGYAKLVADRLQGVTR